MFCKREVKQKLNGVNCLIYFVLLFISSKIQRIFIVKVLFCQKRLSQSPSVSVFSLQEVQRGSAGLVLRHPAPCFLFSLLSETPSPPAAFSGNCLGVISKPVTVSLSAGLLLITASLRLPAECLLSSGRRVFYRWVTCSLTSREGAGKGNVTSDEFDLLSARAPR